MATTPNQPDKAAAAVDKIVPQIEGEQLPAEASSDLLGVPSTSMVNVMWRFAACIKDAPYLPRDAQGSTPAVFYLLSTAHDLGLKWTHGIRGLYMVKGKVGMEGNVALALLLKNKFRVNWPNVDQDGNKVYHLSHMENGVEKGIRWVCQISRPECDCPFNPETRRIDCKCGASFEEEFSMEEASRIMASDRDDDGNKATKKLSEKFVYKAWGRDMVRWRALMRTGRIIAADVLGGAYSPDEVAEISAQTIDVTPTPASVEEKAGLKAETQPDESLIPPELESELREAAHQAGKHQKWAVAKITELQGRLQAFLVAGTLDMTRAKVQAKALVSDAIAELTAEKPAQPEPKPRGRRSAREEAKAPEAQLKPALATTPAAAKPALAPEVPAGSIRAGDQRITEEAFTETDFPDLG